MQQRVAENEQTPFINPICCIISGIANKKVAKKVVLICQELLSWLSTPLFNSFSCFVGQPAHGVLLLSLLYTATKTVHSLCQSFCSALVIIECVFDDQPFKQSHFTT
jgi:hypothetical protein